MSRSTIRNQIYLDSSQQPIQTGTWFGPPINIDEHRRVNLTVAVGSSTGANSDCGGFTGTLIVQGTDELATHNGVSGQPYYGVRSPSGIGWQTIPSGTFAVTKATQVFSLSFTDVGFAYIRPCFNVTGGVTGALAPSATGCLGGSGTMNIWLTGKHT
jgi:hypothetical protein